MASVFRLSAAAILFLCLGCVPVAGADAGVDLELSGATLAEAIAQLGGRAKLDVLVGTDVARPEEFGRFRIWLDGRGMPVRQALDWLARALGTRYRYDPVGKAVWFTSSYGWVGREAAPVEFHALGGIVGDGGRAAFLERLGEVMKTPDIMGPSYTLRIRPEDGQLVAILPPVLQERLLTILGAMAGAPSPLRAAEPDPECAAVFAALERMVIADYPDMPLNAVLSDIAAQSGLNIACDASAFAAGKPPSLTLRLGEKRAREVLEAVCIQVGLRRIVPDPPMAVWLTADGGTWRQTGSRELLWESVTGQAYDISRFSRDPGGEAVAHRVRAALSVDWREDASVGVVYQPVRHALIVAASAELHGEVARILAVMAAEREGVKGTGDVRPGDGP